MSLPCLVSAQTSNAPSSLNLKDEMKWLAGVVDGATGELGINKINYDLYSYENFGYEGCDISLRETRKFYENRKLISTRTDDVIIPLGSLVLDSVRLVKVGASLYKVSFTAMKPNPLIGSRQKVTYPDGRTENSYGGREDYGILFREISVARRASRALQLGIHSCQSAKKS